MPARNPTRPVSPTEPARARRWLLTRARIARWLPPAEQRSAYGWAIAAGIVAAACVLLIRLGLTGVQWLLTQSTQDAVATARALPEWRRLATPALGGLLAGALVVWGRRFTRDQPMADYMEAITVGDGVVRGRPALLRALAALFSIGSGGSLGREGPLLQLAAAITSSLGRHAGLAPQRLPLAVSCVAAAALAATYHAPLAGALFVAEIILGTIAAGSLGPIVVASVTAVAITRPVLGTHALFPGTVFRFQSAWELPLFLLVGILLGVLAPAFVHLIGHARRSFQALHLPLPLQLALGGLMVGAISLVVPDVWGNGFESLTHTLRGEGVTTGFLLLLLVAKLAATTASVGSGAIGGVFTPMLLVGGIGGWAFGDFAHRLWPTHTGVPAAYALIGMGAFFAACTHAPLTAVVMVFELTLNPDAIAPLLLTTVAAHVVARTVSSESVYSANLRNRAQRDAAQRDTRALHRPPPPTIRAAAPLAEVAREFRSTGSQVLVVVEEDGTLLGGLRLSEIRDHLGDPTLAHLVTAGDLADPHPTWVGASADLGKVLTRFTECDQDTLWVVEDAANARGLVGQIHRRDALLMAAHGTAW